MTRVTSMEPAKHAAFQVSFHSSFKKALTFVGYLPLFSPMQLCSHLLPTHTSSDPEQKFYVISPMSEIIKQKPKDIPV